MKATKNTFSSPLGGGGMSQAKVLRTPWEIAAFFETNGRGKKKRIRPI